MNSKRGKQHWVSQRCESTAHKNPLGSQESCGRIEAGGRSLFRLPRSSRCSACHEAGSDLVGSHGISPFPGPLHGGLALIRLDGESVASVESLSLRSDITVADLSPTGEWLAVTSQCPWVAAARIAIDPMTPGRFAVLFEQTLGRGSGCATLTRGAEERLFFERPLAEIAR